MHLSLHSKRLLHKISTIVLSTAAMVAERVGQAWTDWKSLVLHLHVGGLGKTVAGPRMNIHGLQSYRGD